VDKLDNLRQQLRQAQQNFDYADENHIDEAIKQMNEVKEKFGQLLKEKKFKKRVNEVKDYLSGMATFNGNIENITEEQLEQDAIETVLGILEDNPNWLNEEW